jgi:hypothetical protein
MFLRNKNTNWQRSKGHGAKKGKVMGVPLSKTHSRKMNKKLMERKGKKNHQSYWGKGMERNSSRLYFLISLC